MVTISNGSKLTSMGTRALKSIALPFIVYAVMSALAPRVFLSWNTAAMMVTQSLVNIAVGWAMLFGFFVGLIDFSVGARISFAGLTGFYFGQIYGLPGYLIGCIAMSLVLALVAGSIFAFLRVPSIIAGFAACLIFESLANVFSKQFTMSVDSDVLFLGKVPGIYIVVVILFIAIYFIFNNTKFGYQIKAISGNETIAQNMGLYPMKLKLMTFIVGGSFLGIATILSTSYQGRVVIAANMQSMFTIFTPMMGVLIGLSLKACNPVIGVIIGELSITIVSTALVALGVESRLQNVVIGTFLLLFIGVQNTVRFKPKVKANANAKKETIRT